MAAKNDVTGDSIRTKTSNPNAYAKGWDRIFGKSKYKTQRKGLRTSLNSSKRKKSSENRNEEGML